MEDFFLRWNRNFDSRILEHVHFRRSFFSKYQKLFPDSERATISNRLKRHSFEDPKMKNKQKRKHVRRFQRFSITHRSRLVSKPDNHRVESLIVLLIRLIDSKLGFKNGVLDIDHRHNLSVSIRITRSFQQRMTDSRDVYIHTYTHITYIRCMNLNKKKKKPCACV